MSATPAPLPDLDAWAFGRLLVGGELNGEMARVSAPNRPLAERLAGLPGDDRLTAWEAHLAALPDAAAWVEAVAAFDPDADPPEPDEAPGDGWTPLGLKGLPPVDPFPVDVLPGPVRRLVVEGADSIGCPVDFLALPVLAIAGGVAGRSVSLMLKENYFVVGCTFAAVVGPPSDGKTPAIKIVAAPVRKIDEALATEWAEAMKGYAEAKAAFEASKSGKTKGSAHQPSEPVSEPERPVPRRIDVDDTTMEMLPNILADNERGLVMIRDELTAFAQGMNQFKGGKGNDRSNALKIWSGDAIKKDRVGHQDRAPIRVPFPTLTVVGGLTPDMLGEMADPKGRADGFVDRFLMTYPDPRPVPEWSDRGLPQATAEGWARVVARLWSRTLDASDGKPRPHVARFSPGGKAAWRARFNEHAAEMNGDDFDASQRGPWGKFRDYAGRLALILALLRHAADATPDADEIPEVDARDVDGAWRLVAYFKGHTRRVAFAMKGGDGLDRDAYAVLRWIRRNRPAWFSQSELTRNFPRFRDDPKAMGAAITGLKDLNAIRDRPEPHAPAGKRGRKPAPSFDVHPALLAPENCDNCSDAGPEPNSRKKSNSPAPQDFPRGEEAGDAADAD